MEFILTDFNDEDQNLNIKSESHLKVIEKIFFDNFSKLRKTKNKLLNIQKSIQKSIKILIKVLTDMNLFQKFQKVLRGINHF